MPGTRRLLAVLIDLLFVSAPTDAGKAALKAAIDSIVYWWIPGWRAASLI